MTLNELSPGDRFQAVGALWAFLEINDENEVIARKITSAHPGANESVCSFERTQQVVFVPPAEFLLHPIKQEF